MEFLRKLTGTLDVRPTTAVDIASLMQGNGNDAATWPVNGDPLEKADERASMLTGRLDVLSSRLEALGEAAAGVPDLQARVAMLEQAVTTAEERAAHASARAEAAEAQRDRLEQLVSQATDMLTRLDTIDVHRTDLRELEQQLPSVRVECQQLVDRQRTLTDQCDSLHAAMTSLGTKAEELRHGSFEARDNAERAARTMVDVKEKLEGLSRFDSITRDASGQLQAVNALAERVASKLKALEQQHQTVEHALTESRKVSELVWNMETQITRLQEGATLASRVEETVTRLDRLHADASTQLATAESARTEVATRLDQHRREAADLLRTLDSRVDHLGRTQRELEITRERLDALQSTVTDNERRLTALSASDQVAKGLIEQVDHLSSEFRQLEVHARTVGERQAALTTLESRLTEVEDAAKRTEWQMEQLAERRHEVESLKNAFADLHAQHARAQAIADGLRADTHSLEDSVGRADTFMRELPVLVASIDAAMARVADIESRAERALAARPVVDRLAAQVEQLAPRLELVDDVQQRLHELHGLSATVDSKMAAVLARQADIDAVRVACSGLSAQLLDAQHNYEGLAAAQRTAADLPSQLTDLERQIEATRAKVRALHVDTDVLERHEQTLDGFNESAAALARELAERLEIIRAAQSDLSYARPLQEQVHADLIELQALQRDALAGTRETHDQIQQLSKRFQEISDRRTEIAKAEQAVSTVTHRVGEVESALTTLDTKIDAVAGRERIVAAVREEVESIHGVARRVQDDLMAVADGHLQIAQGREDVQRLFDTLGELSAKIADVQSRESTVDEVRRKADTVVGLLDDMHISLNAIGEQKSMVDHVSEQVVRLNDTIEEAKGTTRALQSERKLSQRIVENLRNVHARAGAEPSTV